MSDWREKAKRIAAGKWVRFDAQTPQHTILFTAEPTEVIKTSQQGPSAGEKYRQMSFPVVVDGDERLLEPNKSLLTQLIAEDEEEAIIGQELVIKCLNPEKKTQWRIRRIAQSAAHIESYGKTKQEEPEDKGPAPGNAAPEAVDDKEKQEFLTKVKKAGRKQKAETADPAPGGE